MVNAWSLLFDELNMTNKSKYYYDYDRNDSNRKNPFKVDGYSVNGSSNQDFWEYDGISLTGNPGAASSDTINFSSDIVAAAPVPMDGISGVTGGQDIISFDLPKNSNTTTTKSKRSMMRILFLKNYPIIFLAHTSNIILLDLIEFRLLILSKHVVMVRHFSAATSLSMRHDMIRRELPVVTF